MKLIRTSCGNGYALGLPDNSTDMRGVILWILGVPISLIILLYLFHAI